ncbi:hypothetical protein SSS_06482 [Sarcoptes scabiei]|nr:hypothetical protein SSS_06482 [Sarcoptes scabiei]
MDSQSCDQTSEFNDSINGPGSAAAASTGGRVTPSHVRKHKPCHVLSDKAAQNISILLSVLKRSPESLKRDVITMNEEYLSENAVDQMIHYMPTSDELRRLNEQADKLPLEEFNQAENSPLC